MSDVKPFWIYIHDEDSQFVDEAFADSLDMAIFTAGIWVKTWLSDNPKHAIHVVDQINKDSETVWVAGSCTLGNDHT